MFRSCRLVTYLSDTTMRFFKIREYVDELSDEKSILIGSSHSVLFMRSGVIQINSVARSLFNRKDRKNAKATIRITV